MKSLHFIIYIKYNIRIYYMSQGSNYNPGGVRRLIFTGNVKTSLFNKYTPGSGVGALNASVRRQKYRKAATANLTMAQMDAAFAITQAGGTPVYPPPCCLPTLKLNPSNLAFPHNNLK